MEKMYVGDGLYVEFDGFGIWLRSENGVEILQEVYLEPTVLFNLISLAVGYGMLSNGMLDQLKQVKLLGVE